LKVLIVDDHPIVVSGVKALLEADPEFAVMEASDAETAERIFAQSPPDVAIVDINLPGLSGFGLTRRLIDRESASKIIIFSMNDDPVFVAQAMEVGAKGFISKNDNPALMTAAIRSVAGGATAWPKGAENSISFMDNIPQPISARDHEVLRLLAKGRSLSEIADLVGVSYKTAAGSCAQLRARLGARTQMELVRIAIERKLV
jgi:DNA-binding NarL/FixJ family response regulator